jgi:hypothetical protein
MHSLGAEIFSHPAIGAGSVVVAGLVVAGVVGTASVVAGSVGGAMTASVPGNVGGVDDDVDELSEHAATTPSKTTAIAATRFTYR